MTAVAQIVSTAGKSAGLTNSVLQSLQTVLIKLVGLKNIVCGGVLISSQAVKQMVQDFL